MRTLPLLLLLALAALPVRADEIDDLTEPSSGGLFGLFEKSREAAPAPQVDPKRIINESNSFLKDREPDMTAEEDAMYEKMSAMLSTNPQLAVHMLEAMVDNKDQPSPAFALILGNAYYAANQAGRAEALYRSALKRYPDFLRAWSDLGTLCYGAGRYREAVESFAKAISLGDRDPAVFGLMGYSLEKQGDLVSAEMAYLQALGSDPDNLDWKEGLLRIYLHGRQFGRAEPLARRIIEAQPTEARHWFDYAGILLSEGRKPDAMVVLDEAVAAGAAGPDELELLGDLDADLNLAPEAVAAYRQLLTAAPARGERKLLQFARMLVADGQLPEAERLLDQLAGQLSPSARIEWRRTRADLRIAQQRWPDARQEIEALLALAPLDGRALLVLGTAYMKEGDWPRAILAYESASQVPASAYQANLELANLELQSRHYAKSAGYFEKALSLQRTDVVETAYYRVKALIPHDANSESTTP